ncbi:MAG: hypothetical protein ABIL06_01145 [Pseudomonadota bacterium]
MKKIFIALSVLVALTFSVGQVLAVPGVPDNSPGSDFTCFFSVSAARVTDLSGPTTYYNITNVTGNYVKIELFFYDYKSAFVADAELLLTPWQTKMVDMGTYIIAMSTTDRAKLARTFLGASYYQGYIVANGYYGATAAAAGGTRSTIDNLIGDVYLIDLASGLAAADQIPMREFYNKAAYITEISNDGNYEVWSPRALATATELVWTNTPADAAWFAMYPKYYILDSTGGTYFILWTNGLTYGTTYYATFHLYVINGAEDYQSTSINLYELSFIDAITAIPDGLKVAYPYLGVFNLTLPGATSIPAMVTSAQFLGWTWQYANSGATTAATNWDILTGIARDVGTSGSAPYPVHPQ